MPAGSIHYDGPIQPPPGMVQVTQPTQLPEPAPEQSEEGRSLVQINRIRRSLIQAVEDLRADVAAQRDNVRAAAGMFGDPVNDGTQNAEQAVATQTARLNGLLAELATAKANLAAHVEEFPTAEEIEARIVALRKLEFAEARQRTLLTFRTKAEEAIQHVIAADALTKEMHQLALDDARQCAATGRKSHFANINNAKEVSSLILDQWPIAKQKGGGDAATWLRNVLANQI